MSMFPNDDDEDDDSAMDVVVDDTPVSLLPRAMGDSNSSNNRSDDHVANNGMHVRNEYQEDNGDDNTETEENDDDNDDMGYEECVPQVRRGSMTMDQEKDRRASIKAVMADPHLSPITKRRSIQHLMDGRRRNSLDNNGSPSYDRRNSCTGVRRSSLVGGGGSSSCGSTASLRSSEEGWVSAGANASSSSSILTTTMTTTAEDYHHHHHHVVVGVEDLGYDNSEEGGWFDWKKKTNSTTKKSTTTNNNNTATHCGVISNDQTRAAEQSRPVCSHYDRRCTMIAPCCGGAFGCRICHDDCPSLPPKINNSDKRWHRSASLPSSFTSMPLLTEVPQDNHHNIDRFSVAEVICRECFTRQSSKTNCCVSCSAQFGAYHCDICNLWMSDKEQPYHCADCGFCRVGGSDNFLHCHDCGMYIDRTLYQNHNCKEGKYRSNCPVCQEYLFNSRGASHEMPCGHAIHWDCFRQMAVHDSRCPVCKKTAETPDRMMPTWNAMAVGIALQPVPPELSRVVDMTCNDCERNEDGVAWHFLGMQCSHCSSFNTVVDQIVLQGEEAYEFLETNRHRSAAMLSEYQQHPTQQFGNNDEQGFDANSGEADPSRPGGERRHRANRRRSAF